jgi:hypothetical protein
VPNFIRARITRKKRVRETVKKMPKEKEDKRTTRDWKAQAIETVADINNFFRTGPWTPQLIAFWLATNDPEFYARWGGNLSLYEANIQRQDVMQVSGPDEIRQLADARMVAERLTDHWDELDAEMVRKNLSMVASAYRPVLTRKNNTLAFGGLNLGAAPEMCLHKMRDVGYSENAAIELFASVLTSYGADWMSRPLVDYLPALWHLQPDFFGGKQIYVISFQEGIAHVDVVTGYISAKVADYLADAAVMYQIGGEMLHIPIHPDVNKAASEKLKAAGYKFAMAGHDRQSVSGYKTVAVPAADGVVAGYLGLAIRGLPDELSKLADDFVDRFEAVKAVSTELTARAYQAASETGILYGLTDMISPIPVTPETKKRISSAPSYNVNGHFPVILTNGFILTAMNGVNPLMYAPGDDNYEPAEHVMPGLGHIVTNPEFLDMQLTAWVGALGTWKCSDMAESVKFTSYEPNASDAYGRHVASKFGAPLMWKTEGNTTAFPNFVDPIQWHDLQGALDKGLCTRKQIANLAQMGLMWDPAKRLELIEKPIPSVIESYRALPNQALLVDCWKEFFSPSDKGL